MTPNIDLDHLRTWIGRGETHDDVLTPRLAAQFSATFDRDDDCSIGAQAVPLIHFCLGIPVVPTRGLGDDGHPALGGFLPPVPLPLRMWAGGTVSFHAALRIGDTITRRSIISDVILKQGRSGALVFVTVEHEITRDGNALISERQDIVYRGGESAKASAATVDPAPAGEVTRQIAVNPIVLFRYSALTFNAHRIHYDAPYAGDIECYPGLVIHGPLQATLLCALARDVRGIPPKSFTFRSLSPLFGNEAFSTTAMEDAGQLRLWTARDNGPVAMEASATWD